MIVADANRVVVFGPAPPGPPMIDSVSSQNIDPTSTRLEAQIDANGIDTHYYFQYGTADCKVSPSVLHRRARRAGRHRLGLRRRARRSTR